MESFFKFGKIFKPWLSHFSNLMFCRSVLSRLSCSRFGIADNLHTSGQSLILLPSKSRTLRSLKASGGVFNWVMLLFGARNSSRLGNTSVSFTRSSHVKFIEPHTKVFTVQKQSSGTCCSGCTKFSLTFNHSKLTNSWQIVKIVSHLEIKFFETSSCTIFGHSSPNSPSAPSLTLFTLCIRAKTTWRFFRSLQCNFSGFQASRSTKRDYLCFSVTPSKPTNCTKGAFISCCNLSSFWLLIFAVNSSSRLPYLEVIALIRDWPKLTFCGRTNEPDVGNLQNVTIQTEDD